MRRLATLAGVVLTATAAGAHPDHVGGSGVGLAHYVSDPFHLATGILAAGALLSLVAAWWAYQQRLGRAHRRR